MIRIRAGELWKRAAAGGPASEVAGHAKGAVGIEVDGVEISGGVLEDLLFPSAAALVEAAHGLVSGEERTAAVPFAEGAFELLLARRGGEVAISLVSLTRPARVLVRDLVVDLEPLSRAAVEFGEELLAGLRELSPDALAAGPARRLRRACERLSRAEDRGGLPPAAPPTRVHSRPAGGGLAPTVGFDLRDDEGRLALYAGGEDLHALLAEGHVYLHGPDGEELAAVSGSPFLVLRDLGEGAARLLAAVREGESALELPLGAGGPTLEVDLTGGVFTVSGRSLPCPPGDLARALLEAGLHLCGALAARNPRLAANPYVESLAQEARERLELCRQLFEAAPARPVRTPRAPPRPSPGGPRLVPGELRRVSLQPAWRAAVGDLSRLVPCGPFAWALGHDVVTVLELATGEVAHREGPLTHVASCADVSVLLTLDRGALTAREAGGATRWRSEIALASLEPRFVVARPPGGGEVAALVADGGELLGVELATGRLHFRLPAPGAVRGAVAAAGSLVAFAADNGVLYGVDAGTGETAFQFPGGGRLSHVAAGGELVAAAAPSAEGAHLLGASAATGARAFDVILPVRDVGDLVPVPGGLVLAGAGTTGGEVLKVDAAGKLRWRARPILGEEPPALRRVPGAVFARGSEGVCRIERGRVRWSMPCGPGGAPLVVRGVLLLPGSRLDLFDALTGRPVATPGAELPAADHVVVHGASIAAAAEDGEIVGLSLRGGLSVV